MKTTRVYIVLYMFFSLNENGYFNQEETMASLGISRSSFFRALSDFRCYLLEKRPFQDLVLEETTGKYTLKAIDVRK